jgi:hypothetical protein
MSTEENPDRTATVDDLTRASLAAILLYGLTLGDEDPVLGVLTGVRGELGLIVSLAEGSRPGTEFDLAEIGPVLEGIGRRLDVAIELMTRSQRGRTTSDLLAHDARSTLNGKVDGPRRPNDQK